VHSTQPNKEVSRMTITTTIRTLLMVTATAAVLASTALAAGEPKNELPFTRISGAAHVATLALEAKHATSRAHAPVAEAKNVLPFTRHQTP
jgi:hypothetical protein